MKRCHLLCNAHLDPVWQWRWEEGAGACLSTFRAAAQFCEESDTLIFNHNEAILYEWTEKYDPALFRRISRLIKEGKWRVMGGWYLQPDCNMPSGESMVRQIQTGLRYFEENFGVCPTVAVNVDSFGHSRGLVQILCNAGFTGYLCMRPEGEVFPRDLVWEGFAGQEILVNRCIDAYNSPLYGAREKVERILSALPPEREVSLILWGVGNHGGGPSRRDIRELDELIRQRKDWTILHSTPEAYFADLETQRSQLPRIRTDLNYYNQGCYTSQIRIKQLHQQLENELYRAEKMAAHAAACCQSAYPSEELKAAERDLLFSEFHDILPGSAVEVAEQDGIRLLCHGLEEVSRVTAKAFFALTAGEKPAVPEEYPILVYNPHPFPLETVIDCELMLADGNWSDRIFLPHLFSEGPEIPCQLEKEGSNMPLDWRKRVVFRARLKPFTVSRFSCFFRQEGEWQSAREAAGPITLTGKDARLVIDSNTGLIRSYQTGGRQYLSEGSGEVRVIRDTHDSWGTQFNEFREDLGRFTLLDREEAAAFAGVQADSLSPVRILEDGPVRTVVEALFGYGRSRLAVWYIMNREDSHFTVRMRAENAEHDVKWKWQLHTAARSGQFFGGTMFGENELPLGEEVVAQDYVMLTEGENAVSCLHFGTYGTSSDGSTLGMTLLRSPAYTSYAINEKSLREDRYSPRCDRGQRDFRFVVNASVVTERRKALPRENAAAHQPPVAMNLFPGGSGENLPPLLQTDCPGLVISSFRQLPDGRYSLRLYHALPERETVTLRTVLNPEEIRLEMQAYEFVTLVFTDGAWEKVNLKEESML